MTGLAATLIGRDVFATGGARVGRIIAIIHGARGADVLVEQRRWLLRGRSFRFRLEEIEQLGDGPVVLRPWTALTAGALHTEPPGEVAAGRR